MEIFKKIVLIFVLFVSFWSFGIINGAPDTSNIAPLDDNTTGVGNPNTSTLPALDAWGLSERMWDPAHSATNWEDLANKLWVNSWEEWTWILTKIVEFARWSIFNLLWVVVVWVLLYIWFKLVIWRWTPDIFKKAIMWLVYLVVWIILIFSAWAMIKIILWVWI